MVAPKKTRKRRQKIELEIAIETVLKASPIQKAKYRRALIALHRQLQREQKELALRTASIAGEDEQSHLDLAYGNSSDPVSNRGPSSVQRDNLHNLPVDNNNGREPQVLNQDAVIDLCLAIAREESRIIEFFEQGGHLLCHQQMSRTEDRRVRDFAEWEGRDESEQRTRFRKLLAILSLATDYRKWELVQLNANRSLHEIAVSVFVEEHPNLFPDKDTARRAIYAGRRYQDQDERFAGTSAIMTFVSREFDRAGPLERLNTHFELEEFHFIPKLGLRFSRCLQQARQGYEADPGTDIAITTVVAGGENSTSVMSGSISLGAEVRADNTACQEVHIGHSQRMDAQFGKYLTFVL